MTYLGIDEMDIVLSEMSESEIKETMDNLTIGYKEKRIKLGHALTEEEETRIRDDLLSDNIMYLKALKEIKNRYQRQASEAWRAFDDESDEWIQKIRNKLSEEYPSSGLDGLLGRD